MSIWSTASRFIQTTFNTATSSVETVGKGLDIVNNFVDDQHKRITKTSTTAAQLSVAQFNDEIAQQLNASESLKAQFDSVVKNW